MTQMTAALSGPWVREPRRLHFPVEAEVPETKEHLELRTALYLIVKAAFADRAVLGSDQFVYWDPTDPAACVAPDVFVRLGGPDELFDSWKVWERGAPDVAVEITSTSDTGQAPWSIKLERYRRLGVRELVRFDPADPERPLRVWDHIDGDLVERRMLRPTSTASVPLGLFWVARVEVEGARPRIRLSEDADGTRLLPTPDEATLRAWQAVQEARARAAEAQEEAAEARSGEAEAREEASEAREEASEAREEASGAREEASEAREEGARAHLRIQELEAELRKRPP